MTDLVKRLPEMLAAAGAEGKAFGPASVALCQAAPAIASAALAQADRIEVLEREVAGAKLAIVHRDQNIAELVAARRSVELDRVGALKRLAEIAEILQPRATKHHEGWEAECQERGRILDHIATLAATASTEGNGNG